MNYRLATKQERAEHNGVYPLHAIIEEHGHTFLVEDLRCFPKHDPQWEVLAPDGHAFVGYGTHSMLEWSIADIKDIVKVSPIEVCHCSDADCDLYWQSQEQQQ